MAVKVLPEHLAHDPERLARFEREAKTLALLNHPHIAQIHGFEHAVPSTTAGQPGSGPAVRALVMELVEGPTLADRIADGPIPLDEAWPIARQIAEALEAAHDQGLVHRDLKPANIKVRPDGMVKVLDFGLAKATTSDSGVLASDSLANSPTIASPAHLHHGYGAAGTEAGMILGTAAYMSPEQAKGKPVDRRADIWAFGCVLFEMLTGRWVFDPSTSSGSPRAASRGEGQDVSETLASVLRAEPAWSALPAATPARVRTLLRRCIERDLKKRLPHIGVARLELAAGATDETQAPAVTTHGPPARAGWRTHAAWAAVAAAALASGVALSTRNATSSAAPRAVMRFEITPPDGLFFPGANGVPRFAVSPDGAAIAFTVTVPGQRDALYIRRLSDLEARPLNGTDTPANGGDAQQQPFFSPDGRFVAYFSGAESALKRVPVAGGPVERLATLPTRIPGGTWQGDVILVASAGTKGIQRLPASGGPLTPVTTLDQSRGEGAHLWPQFLPDGEHFIYLALAGDDTTATYVGSLTGGAPIKLVETPAMSRFAAPDRLLFVRGDALLSQAIDMQTFTLVGEPVVAFDGVMVADNTRVGVSTSENGVAVMASGRRNAGNLEVWSRGRAGQTLEPAVLESPVAGSWVRLSPDGRSLAFARGPGMDVWVKDLDRGIVSRVSTSGRSHSNPVWTPDGRRLIYRTSEARGRSSLHVRDIAGLEAERLLHEASPGHQVLPEDVSPDGRHLMFRDVGAGSGTDLMVLPLDGSAPPRVYLSDGFRHGLATFSPDGQWVAYTSNENGQPQVFVRSFPDPSRAKHQVSNDGASYPRWRHDGRELFFVDQLNRVSVAPVDLRGGFSLGRPTPLFEIPPTAGVTGGVSLGGVLDVFPDGQRFAIVAPRTVASGVTLTVAVDWMADLKK